MRRALSLLAFASCTFSSSAHAQQALAQNVTLPSGVTVARACDKLVSEGVKVASVDNRMLPAQSAEYFTTLAQVIARRVGVRAGDPPRSAMFGVQLMHDGSFKHQIPVVRAGDRELDTKIVEALDIASDDPDRLAPPAGMPDTLRVLVTLGVNDDGSPFTAPHVRCPAVAFPDNPKHGTAEWAPARARTVVIRGVVMPGGRVDSATAHVEDPGDDRYIGAALDALAQMRFVPAEFDGVKVPAPIEIMLPFGTADVEEEATSP